MDSTSVLKHKFNNFIHSVLIFTGMILLMSFPGWFIGGAHGLKWLFFIGIFMLMLSPRLSPHIMLRLYGARRLHPGEVPRLYAALEELTQRANLPNLPKLYYVPSRMLNAFTMGKRNHAAIAITDGLMRALDFRELIGVLAHEVSHVRNNGMWIMNLSDIVGRLTSVFSMVGQFLLFLNLPLILLAGYEVPWLPILILIFAPLLMVLLQLALSRTREFDADLEAATLTGDPEGLASALAKMESYQGGLLRRIFFPGHRNPHPSVLRTHPETEERIKRLLSLVEKKPAHAPIRSLFDEKISGMPLGLIQVQRKPRWRIGGLWY
jgi:heat shock protein HtpX